MGGTRAPSRRTVLAVAGVGALVALALVLSPRNAGPDFPLEVVLLLEDGSAASAARFDAATLERLRRPERAPAPGEDDGSPPAEDAPRAPDAGEEGVAAPAGPPAAAQPPPSAPGDPEADAADTLPEPPTLRIPLVLAARAEGGRAARPEALRLAVPAPFRLAGAPPAAAARAPDAGADVATDADAEAPAPAAGERGWGEPLTYYSLALRDAEIAGGEPPAPITIPDTVWLEYDRRDVDCVLDADSVPRFLPAASLGPGALQDVRLFYSLSARRGERHTGVLRLALEPPAPPPPAPDGRGPPDLRLGGFPLADSALLARSSYEANCTDGARSHVLTVRFLASEVGPSRAYLVGAGDAARLRLEDLDGDDVIEREAWDADGDGRFEASRPMRLALPDVLDSPQRREFIDRQRAALAELAAAEAARRAAAWRARAADTTAAPPVPQARDSAAAGADDGEP